MNKEERVGVKISGLTCDNTACDYQNDVPFEEYENWLNKPCPKCGENLLTQDDLDTTLALNALVKMFNEMSEEELADLIPNSSKEANEEFCEENDLPSGTERVSIKIKVNNGIHIESITPTKE